VNESAVGRTDLIRIVLDHPSDTEIAVAFKIAALRLSYATAA
jgi:hypothetical protein